MREEAQVERESREQAQAAGERQASPADALMEGLRAVGLDVEACPPEGLAEAVASHFRAGIEAEVEKAGAKQREISMEMEQKIHVLEQGVPPAMAAQYVRLARAYLPDVEGFPEALRAALADFPLPRRAVAGAAAATAGDAPGKGWREMTLGERSRIYRESPERARQLARAAGEAL